MQLLESAFCNLYYGLNLYKFGEPLWNVFGNVRKGEIPPFSVQQAAGLASGVVNTPPPFYMLRYGPSVPTPRGKGHVCHTEIRKGIESITLSSIRTIYSNPSIEKWKYKNEWTCWSETVREMNNRKKLNNCREH